jgi:hypothetical protein
MIIFPAFSRAEIYRCENKNGKAFEVNTDDQSDLVHFYNCRTIFDHQTGPYEVYSPQEVESERRKGHKSIVPCMQYENWAYNTGHVGPVSYPPCL